MTIIFFITYDRKYTNIHIYTHQRLEGLTNVGILLFRVYFKTHTKTITRTCLFNINCGE